MPSPADTSLPRLRCPRCQQIYRVRNASRQKQYSCKTCQVPLQFVDDQGFQETMALQQAPEPNTVALTVPSPGTAEDPSLHLKESNLAARAASAGPESLPGSLDFSLSPSATSASAASTDVRRLLPESFNGYTIVKELARGGMGAVLLAEQTKLRRKVAMKIMLPWAAMDAGAQQRFLREGRAMAKLKHPHIIEVYEVNSVNDMSYLSMEFIEGHTLSRVIMDNSLELARMTAVIGKMARALAYAHARGVIHRDIKPANIMLRYNGEPVLMDFGLAKDFDANTVKLSMTGNIMGTPSYMSPEQAQGQHVDERGDIYSLGAVLYEMLTRQAPFDGDTTIATIYKVVHSDLRPAHELDRSVPASLSRICTKALEKDPARRYQSMDEMAGDLDRFGAGMEITAQGPSTAARAHDWSRKNKSAVSGIAVALAALVLVLLGMQMGWLRPGKTKAEELRMALSSGTPKTRLLHVQALAADLHDNQILPGSPQSADAMAALRMAAVDGDGEVASAAISALGESKDSGAVDILQSQLDSKRPANVRRAALAALSEIGPQGLSTMLLKTIKLDPALEVRLAAVDAMHDVAGPDVMIALLEIAAHGDPPALAAACNKKLGQLRSPDSVLAFYTGGNGALAANAANRMLLAKNEVEQQAEDILNDIDHPNSERPRKAEPYEIAAKKLQLGQRGERLQAAYDLGALADLRAETLLENALQDEDLEVALTVASALSKLPALIHSEKIAGYLRHPSPVTRQAAARAYGTAHPAPPGQPLCDALLIERQGAVQTELALAIGRLKFAGGVAPLLALLSQGTPAASRKAAWALGRLGDKSACNALVDALGNAGNDLELKEELAGALSSLTGENLGTDQAKWREAVKGIK